MRIVERKRMFRKPLPALATLVIIACALAATASLAEARAKFSLTAGGYGLHGFRSYYAPKWSGPGTSRNCPTQYKKHKVQIWTKWGPKWVWVSKSAKVCR
jgi:hypothetical protein